MYDKGKLDPYELFRNSYQRKNRDLLAKMTKINGNAVISGDVSEIAKMLKHFLAFRLANNRPKSLELKIEE